MFKLAFRLFPRLIRSRGLLLLLIALVIACATITSISLFIERIDNTLHQEAATFIAADALVDGGLPTPEHWQAIAEKHQLTTARYLRFRAMLFNGDNMTLTMVKATSDEYPLRGQLKIQYRNKSTPDIVTHGPQSGKIWLAPRLFTALNIQEGDNLTLGNAQFIAEASILQEPDSTMSAFGVAPRVMIHYDDIEATGAVQFGSRVDYNFLLAGTDENIASFKAEIEPELNEHFEWETPENGNRGFSSAMDRAQRFLLLAGCLSIILAGVAIALAAHRFSQTQQNQVALLKSFGVKPKGVLSYYVTLLVVLGICGFALGSFIGWMLHYVILFLLADLIPQDLATVGYSVYAFGAGITFFTLFAFALPPLYALKNIEPSRILRQQVAGSGQTVFSALVAITGTALILWFYSRDIKVTMITMLGLIACIVISAVAARGLLSITQKIQRSLSGFWRLGLANLQRQRAFTALQIFVFATVSLLVLVLFQVRTSLITEWKPQLDNTPNHFVFNIFKDELPQVENFLTQASVEANEFYPMSRGRITRIGDTDIQQRVVDGDRNNYERELNLTWSTILGEDNEIVEGQWWGDSTPTKLLASVEQGYADGLELKVGELLEISLAGEVFTAEVVNIRTVEWDSMNPNFFVIFNKPIADDWAANWITSFYLSPEKKPFVNELLQTFPTLSLIELDQTLTLIKNVVSRVSMAIEFIMVLVLVASLLVLLTSIQSTLDERKRESALLRSFGGKRQFVQRVLLVEFGCIGLSAGIFACFGAEVSLYFIQTELFKLPYSPSLGMWLVAPVLSTALIAVIGYWSTVSTTYVPPIQVLRNQG